MIQLRDIRKRLGKHAVLQGIDLEIDPGQRIALVGSNGAGKTTLIRCLLGEYDYRGEILVDRKNPRTARTEVLGRVGFVPQLPPPLKMPVAQLIRYVAKLCNTDKGTIIEVAARLGFDVDRHRGQAFVRLSGGQKQKLLIATALGRAADILILDEPAANLDPDARRVFFELLAERQDHAVMLISSHRLDEVATLVNRVVELDQGKVVLDDRVADALDLSGRLECHIELVRPEPAFAKTIAEWGFRASNQDTTWKGQIAGPDRLRFLGVLSRYAGLLTALEMTEARLTEPEQNREAINA
jgi:ABC-2 type transport system ATP-binding protein